MNYDQSLENDQEFYEKHYLARDEDIEDEYDLYCDTCGQKYISEEYYADGNEDNCLDCKGHVSEIY